MKGADGNHGAGVRVLAIHRYYWPDTPPYASMLRQIARQWSDAGHRVEVFSTQPSYKPELQIPKRPEHERIDEVDVRRIDLPPDRSGRLTRLADTVRFTLTAFLRVVWGRKYDVVMCSTAPPVVLGFAVSLATKLRGGRFVYHCMDIHPEIGALSGEFRARTIFRFLRTLDTMTCRRAASIVVLSEDMRAALADRDPRLSGRTVVINNFDLPTFDEAVQPSPLPKGDRARLVFTGNLGRFQGLEQLVSTMLEPEPDLDALELVLMGEGSVKTLLTELVAKAPAATRQRVRLLPHGSAASARALVRTADFGIVSLMPGVIRYAYPSKTAMYLAEGTPIIALVENGSELTRHLTAGGYGVAVSFDDHDGLRKLLRHVATSSDDSETSAKSARSAWEENFSAQVLLPRWGDLLDRVTNGGEVS